MTFKRLYYFCEICEDLNLSRTAKRLYVSQQSLSYTICSMEEQLKCTLFVRTASGLQLTEEGSYLYYQYRHILDELSETYSVLTQPSEVSAQPLRVSLDTYAYNTAMHILPHRCLGIPVDYSYCNMDRCIQDVVHGQADVTILPYQPTVPSLRSTLLWKEPLCVLLPAGHRLAGRAAVSLHDLAQESLLLSNCHQDRNEALIRNCKQYGVTFDRIILPQAPLALIPQCAKGRGILLISQHAIKNCTLSSPGICVLPLIEPLSIEMYCVCHSHCAPASVMQFIQDIQGELNSCAASPSSL